MPKKKQIDLPANGGFEVLRIHYEGPRRLAFQRAGETYVASDASHALDPLAKATLVRVQALIDEYFKVMGDDTIKSGYSPVYTQDDTLSQDQKAETEGDDVPMLQNISVFVAMEPDNAAKEQISDLLFYFLKAIEVKSIERTGMERRLSAELLTVAAKAIEAFLTDPPRLSEGVIISVSVAGHRVELPSTFQGLIGANGPGAWQEVITGYICGLDTEPKLKAKIKGNGGKEITDFAYPEKIGEYLHRALDPSNKRQVKVRITHQSNGQRRITSFDRKSFQSQDPIPVPMHEDQYDFWEEQPDAD